MTKDVRQARTTPYVEPARAAPPAALDAVDRELVRLLAEDGRMPNAALAEAVGVAPSTCLVRVRNLRQRGVIRGFHADIDPAAVGRPLQALVAVRLLPEARSGIPGFAQHLASLPGVVNVYFVAGINDFQVHVTTGTPDDLREFVVRLNATAQVAGTETSLIFQHTGRPAGP